MRTFLSTAKARAYRPRCTRSRIRLALSAVMRALPLVVTLTGCRLQKLSSPQEKRPLAPAKMCIPVGPETEATRITTLNERTVRDVLWGLQRTSNHKPLRYSAERVTWAWSHDSKRLAVIDSTGALAIWDTELGKISAMIALDILAPDQLVWSRSDDEIAVSGPFRAERWDLARETTTLVVSTESLDDVRLKGWVLRRRPYWSEDATLLLVPQADESTNLVNGATGQFVRKLVEQTPSRDGSLVALDTGNTGVLATVSTLSGTYHLWDWSTGRSPEPLPLDDSQVAPLHVFATSPEHRWLMMRHATTILQIDPRSLRVRAKLLASGMRSWREFYGEPDPEMCAWSAGGDQLAIAFRGGSTEVSVLDVKYGRVRARGRLDELAEMSDLRWSDGDRALIGTGVYGGRDPLKFPEGSLLEQAWRLESSTSTDRAHEPPAPLPSMASSKLPTRGNVLGAHRLSQLSPRDMLERERAACIPATSPNGKLTLSGIWSGMAVFDTSTGEKRFDVAAPRLSEAIMTDLAPAPTDEPLALVKESRVTYSLEGGVLHSLCDAKLGDRMAWSADARQAAMLSAEALCLWSRGAKTPVRVFKSGPADARVPIRIAWGGSSQLATLSLRFNTAFLYVWDLNAKDPNAAWTHEINLGEFRPFEVEHSGALGFSPQGDLLVGIGSTLGIWDPNTGKKRSTQTFSESRIIGFSQDTALLVIATADGSLRIVDRQTSTRKTTLEAPHGGRNDPGMGAPVWSADGTRIACAITDVGGWRVRVWRVEDGAILSEIGAGGELPAIHFGEENRVVYVITQGVARIVDLESCAATDVSLVRVDGESHLLATTSDGRFDSDDDVLKALVFPKSTGHGTRRFLIGPTLKSRRSQGLWPPMSSSK